jgi:hypothetical protein
METASARSVVVESGAMCAMTKRRSIPELGHYRFIDPDR